MCEKGLVRPSKSKHFAPAFYIENHNEIKREKRRMVINYKQTNDAMEGDAYFLPRKDLIIERVRNMNWFSTFDCKSGFYQIRLTEESKALTTFSFSQGQYELNVLPMG